MKVLDLTGENDVPNVPNVRKKRNYERSGEEQQANGHIGESIRRGTYACMGVELAREGE